MSLQFRILLVASTVSGAWLATAADDTKPSVPDIPKVWDEAALADWVTPVAGLNVRPSHISTKDYYSAAVYNLRSYPAYFPGREPASYWEMLQQVGPKPLIEPEKLKTEAEWLAAGQRVFDEADTPQLRNFDPQYIAQVRSREYLEAQGAVPFADGTMDIMRWVPTGNRPFDFDLQRLPRATHIRWGKYPRSSPAGRGVPHAPLEIPRPAGNRY
jgi:hypothetical protein